jgi:pyruvate dehydrogenase E2 component (dihydrolipoamide acetyltransferase)
MAEQIVMPKMSDTMEEGVVVKWLKREGDRVTPGDALAEIETDKAVLELEAPATGVLRKIIAQEDTKVPVGEPLAVIGGENEDVSSLVGSPGSSSSQPLAVLASTSMVGAASVRPEPPSSDVTGRPEAIARERVDASPLARRMAQEAGIDIALVPGTGPGARVVKRDIEAFLSQRRGQCLDAGTPPVTVSTASAAAMLRAPAPAAATPSLGVDHTEHELSLMRQTIARRMALSKSTVPHFYLTAEIAMERAAALRQSLNELAAEEAKISFNDMILKAVANALRQFPRMNVSYADGQIRRHQRVHVSLAVALDDGLITPVIRDCDRKSLGEIARETKVLTERARARRLKPEDYSGGTFSVSNLGMFGIEECAAIINPPEAAILAVGVIKQQPVIVDGQLGVGQRMKVTLSGDHRAIDGATGAQFLQIVKRLLEQPLTLML